MKHFTCFVLLACTMPLLFGCGSDGTLDFSKVVAIPTGDKEGSALSGDFAVTFEVTSNGCAQVAALEIPTKGTKSSYDITVTQTEGDLRFDEIETSLNGGISFENKFEVGGADIVSRGDEENNILRSVRMTGSFEDANSFSGKGKERLSGRIADEIVDCTYSFSASGIRR